MICRGHGATRALLALVLAVLLAPGLFAFRFSPITQDFQTEGPGASRLFRVANTTSSQIAVRISVRPRSIERDGREIQGEPTDEFLIFPARLLLDPGDQRSVRVVWNGTASPDRELAYRIIAEQLPVNLEGDQPVDGGAIVLTYRYEGSLYVVPQGARPQVAVTAVDRVQLEGRDLLRVTVENSGTRHTLLRQAVLDLSETPSGDPIRSLGPEDLTGLTGENMLSASVRHFYVPLPDGLPDGRLYGTLTIADN